MSRLSDHGGNLRSLARSAGRPASELLDFSANINPLGFPDWLRPLVSSQLSNIRYYPDPACEAMLEAASQRYNVPVENLIAGNGSEELLHFLPEVAGKRRALIPSPAFSEYARTARRGGLEVVEVPLDEQRGFELDLSDLESRLGGDEMVYLGAPNNPTGVMPNASELRALAMRHPDTLFVVDEAFADFVDASERFAGRGLENVVTLLSLTKIFAVPGLRVGLAAGPAGLVAEWRGRIPTWSVNTLAQAVGTEALKDHGFIERSRAAVTKWRSGLLNGLRSIPGLEPFPGAANFLLVRLGADARCGAAELAGTILEKGIAIRVCGNFSGLDDHFFRVAVRTEEENTRLLDGLAAILSPRTKRATRRRTPALMLQGTASNAGKSVLTAALCRIFHQDGLSVAPFKSQNMSLNSYVTRDGLEMGRAQVVQAHACRVEPDVRMNPILLKPNSDIGSQVIVMGKPAGNMSVTEFIRYKPVAFEAAKNAYDSLAASRDVMVIEGAGSPAEVNLKRHDIVNMAMARYAAAPVLIAGDIDRGGVYGSFIGTMETMAEWERDLVAGFIVNRFRGKEELLADAHDHVLNHVGKPVLGVVPFLTDLGLPEEDSVNFKERRTGAVATDKLDIALIDLPHISNFTDFDAFGVEPDACVRVVRKASELGVPDAVILPGSKSVVSDLRFLRASGIADAVLSLAGKSEIIGICGGYQMLGRRIEDPAAVETSGGEDGLGLLPVTTVMAVDKTLKRVSARHEPSGEALEGYEIHHGLTNAVENLEALVTSPEGPVIGYGKGMVWGCYLHGMFDADGFRRWFIDRLRVRRGWKPVGRVVAGYETEIAFDRLAAVVRERLDMRRIYQLMGM